MTRLPFFVATCPSCSIKTQLELQSLGRYAACHGCGNTFKAQGPDSTSAALDDPLHYWINFTDHDILPSNPFSVDTKEIGRTPR